MLILIEAYSPPQIYLCIRKHTNLEDQRSMWFQTLQYNPKKKSMEQFLKYSKHSDNQLKKPQILPMLPPAQRTGLESSITPISKKKKVLSSKSIYIGKRWEGKSSYLKPKKGIEWILWFTLQLKLWGLWWQIIYIYIIFIHVYIRHSPLLSKLIK